MKYDGFYHVSLQQIQIFLKCYEIRKFSRVAFEYNYTPSMISKTIRQMEIILGYELFVREHHMLKPTAAADVLAREWREFDSMITRGLDRAYAVHHTMGLTVKMSVAGDSLFLAEYPFIILNPNKYPSNYELLMAVAEKYDFVPKIAVSCDNTESAKDNLHFGRGLYLANSLTTSGWEDEDTRIGVSPPSPWLIP